MYKHTNTASVPMPIFSPTLPVFTTAFPSNTTAFPSNITPPSHPNTASNPLFQSPIRPIVRNPYKRPANPQNVEPNPNEDLKAQLDGSKKELVTLKMELTDTVAVCENQKVENNNMVSSLRSENRELRIQIESINKVNSPLKRKLADIYVDL